ncbi:MAG: hypothetical protein J6Y02_23660 [Pseudobutyrivibrio sp.]|nr:hypothetical protein [Pseudobutyrivibrio sp.]
MQIIKGYFFNAKTDGQTYDRLYNNEDFCGYLDKIIHNGVFPDPIDQLKVVADGGMTVKVNPGQAWINGHKLVLVDDDDQNNGDVLDPFTLSAPETQATTNTYRVYITADDSESVRKMTITCVLYDGETPPAKNQLVLADIRVVYGTTVIDSTMITDYRGDPTLCPWVAGLVNQIDPDGLLNPMRTAYQNMLDEMQADFESWFINLQQALTVSADLLQYRKVVNGGEAVSKSVPLDMIGYTYDKRDLMYITMNGLLLAQGTDYTIDSSDTTAILEVKTNNDTPYIPSGNTLSILVVKSSLQSSADGIVTLITGDTFVNISDAIFNEELRKLDIVNMVEGIDNKVAITNRNLARVDIFEDAVVGTVSFEKTVSGKIAITGSTEDAVASIRVPLPENKGCFLPGDLYTLSINNTDLNPDDQISVYISIDGTRYSVDANDGDITFTIPNEFSDITLVVMVSGLNREAIDTTLAIQLEYGGHTSEWTKNIYAEYVVDGINMPVLYDIANNIWIITEGASGLRAAYFVLNSTSSGDSIGYPLD